MPFAALGLSPALCSSLGRLGYAQPTPVQTGSIPVVLSGSDLEGRRRRAREHAGGPVEIGAPAASATVDGIALRVPILSQPTWALRPRWTGELADVLRAVEMATGVDRAELLTKTRRQSASATRRLALLVWTRELHRPAIEMARALGLSSSSAAGLISSASSSAREAAAALSQRLRDGAMEEERSVQGQ
jgi:hypothetical protein